MKYILIDSLQRFIQLGRKQMVRADLNKFDPHGVLAINTIDFNLPLAEIYLGAEF